MNIVIVGMGDLGIYLATLLSKNEHNVIVVEKNKKKLEELERNLDVAIRNDSGTDWQLLEELLDLSPDMLIAVTHEDEINLVCSSLAKHLGYPYTIARLKDDIFLKQTRLDFSQIFDVDYLIAPEILVAHEIHKHIISQGTVSIDYFAHGAVKLLTMIIPASWGKRMRPLNKLHLPKGTIVGLIFRKTKENPKGEIIFPHGQDVLLPDDEVTFIGEPDQVNQLPKFFGIPLKQLDSVVIIGGSLTAIHLAKLLHHHNFHVTIIDKDYETCCSLAKRLPFCKIINHEAADKDFLCAEKIDQADLVVTCTQHDEFNLTCALLAKEIGAKDVVAILSNTHYFSLAESLGIQHVVSPKIVTANRILSQIVTGSVSSLISLYENRAEIVEIQVSQDSKLAGIPLADLGPLLPQDFLIAVIQNRGRIMVADGKRIISPQDTVIVITAPEHVPHLEKIF